MRDPTLFCLALGEEILAVLLSPAHSLSSQVDPVSKGAQLSCCHPHRSTQSPSPHTSSEHTYHLLALTGPDQLAEEQLQHSLTVEQATPVQGGDK